uniref:DUF1618 domain-containing protein n=1 Tax=Oryza punctata TaxID=4537 RepID=A0A0E0KKS5_ORYPU
MGSRGGGGEDDGGGGEVDWALLFTLPVPVTDEELPPVMGGMAIRKQAPPLTSFLCLPQRSLGEDGHSFIEIICADSTGRLAHHHHHRTPHRPPPLLLLCRHGNLSSSATPQTSKSSISRCRSVSVRLVMRPRSWSGQAAVLADPRDEDGDAYVVVVLLQSDSLGEFHKILCYESKNTTGLEEDAETHDHDLDQYWIEKLLSSSSQQPPRGWHGHRAIPLDGDLVCWIDSAYGLLLRDVLSEEPTLRHMPLPNGRTKVQDDDMGALALAELLKRRCIGLSDGKIRFLEIDSSGILIAVWTLALNDGDGTAWEHTSSIDLVSLRADESFQEVGLDPHRLPSLAAIHPTDSRVIFLVQNSVIFSVSSDATASSRVSRHQKFLFNENDITASQFLFPWVVHDPEALLLQETHDPAALPLQETLSRSSCLKKWIRAIKFKRALKRGIIWLSSHHDYFTFAGDAIDFLPVPAAGSLRAAAICARKVGAYCSKTGKILKFHNSRLHMKDPPEPLSMDPAKALPMENFQIINSVNEVRKFVNRWRRNKKPDNYNMDVHESVDKEECVRIFTCLREEGVMFMVMKSPTFLKKIFKNVSASCDFDEWVYMLEGLADCATREDAAEEELEIAGDKAQGVASDEDQEDPAMAANGR